jgi:hypothetical protein
MPRLDGAVWPRAASHPRTLCTRRGPKHLRVMTRSMHGLYATGMALGDSQWGQHDGASGALYVGRPQPPEPAP